MSNTRKYTNALLTAVEEGTLSSENILKELVSCWLSEAQVQEFVKDNDWEELLGFGIEEEEEQE